jgi:hypothetical protein
LGVRHYFLGIEVASPSVGSLVLRQRKYALDLLACAGMLKCSPVTMPMSSSEWLCSADGDVLSFEEAPQYRNLGGGLQYLTITRPDLSFVVNKVCTFLNLVLLIWPLSSAFCVMCATLWIVVCIFNLQLRLFCHSLMLIRQAVWMIGDPRGDMLYFMEVI